MTALGGRGGDLVLTAVVAAGQQGREEVAATVEEEAPVREDDGLAILARGSLGSGGSRERLAGAPQAGEGAGVARLEPVRVGIEVLERVEGLAQLPPGAPSIPGAKREEHTVEERDEPLLARSEALPVEVLEAIRLVLIDLGVGPGGLLDGAPHRAGLVRGPEELGTELRHRPLRHVLVGDPGSAEATLEPIGGTEGPGRCTRQDEQGKDGGENGADHMSGCHSRHG